MTGRSQVRRHEVHRSKNYKVKRDHARNTNVARLREIALANTIMLHCARDTDVMRLREIALASTMSHHDRDTDVARLREIVLTRTMSQDYHRSNKVSRIGEGSCS